MSIVLFRCPYGHDAKFEHVSNPVDQNFNGGDGLYANISQQITVTCLECNRKFTGQIMTYTAVQDGKITGQENAASLFTEVGGKWHGDKLTFVSIP